MSWILPVIAERLKNVRSFIWLIQSKACNTLFVDITRLGVNDPQETDLPQPTSITMQLRILIGESFFFIK